MLNAKTRAARIAVRERARVTRLEVKNCGGSQRNGREWKGFGKWWNEIADTRDKNAESVWMCKRSVICLLVGVCVKVLVHFHSVLLDGFQDLWINILIKYITINYGRCWWAFFQANVYSFPPAGTQPNCITAAKHCQNMNEWLPNGRKKLHHSSDLFLALSGVHSGRFLFHRPDFPIIMSGQKILQAHRHWFNAARLMLSTFMQKT